MERRPLAFGNAMSEPATSSTDGAGASKPKLNGHHYPSMIGPVQEGTRAKFEDFTPFASGFC